MEPAARISLAHSLFLGALFVLCEVALKPMVASATDDIDDTLIDETLKRILAKHFFFSLSRRTLSFEGHVHQYDKSNFELLQLHTSPVVRLPQHPASPARE